VFGVLPCGFLKLQVHVLAKPTVMGRADGC